MKKCPIFVLFFAQLLLGLYCRLSDQTSYLDPFSCSFPYFTVILHIVVAEGAGGGWQGQEGNLARSLPYLTSLSSPQRRVQDPLGFWQELCRLGKQLPSQPDCAAARKTFHRESWQGVVSGLSLCLWSLLWFVKVQNSKTYEIQQVVVRGCGAAEDKPLKTVSGQLELPSKSGFSWQTHRLMLGHKWCFLHPLLFPSSAFTSVVLSGTLHLHHAVAEVNTISNWQSHITGNIWWVSCSAIEALPFKVERKRIKYRNKEAVTELSISNASSLFSFTNWPALLALSLCWVPSSCF